MANRDVRYLVVKDHAGQRLDNFLLRELRPVPKSRVMRMIRRGEVRVNGRRSRVSLRLTLGDRIRVPPVSIAETPPKSIPAWLLRRIQQSVLHEDRRLIVLNKPSGIAVHSGGSVEVGLVDVVRELYNEQRIDLVHRIDQATSGCVVFARSRVAMLEMHHAFQQRKVEKQYDAIVYGVWPPNLTVVNRPIGRFSMPNGERRAKIDESGQEAITAFSIQDQCASASWMRVKPITGRTHQIRVHAASTGHFVLGDAKYSQRTSLPRATRLMLHAANVSIGNELAVHAPLDEAFTDYWTRLVKAD